MSTGRNDGKAKTEESARGGTGPIGWVGAERRQEARQQGKWSEGGPGQKPQDNSGRQTQCGPATAWTPQESLNELIEKIRDRFGNYAIARGDGGIRYSAPTLP
jgi:hypothetical protein